MLETSAIKAMGTEHLISSLWARGNLNAIEEELLIRLEFTFHELRYCAGIVNQRAEDEDILDMEIKEWEF